MAASGYMTELDTESIWKTSLTTARFDKINVRIGQLLNFEITGDAATDITSTKVLPILEQISEEVLFEIIVASKGVGESTPWHVAASMVTSIFNRMIGNYWRTIKKIQDVLYDTLQMTNISGFGSSGNI